MDHSHRQGVNSGRRLIADINEESIFPLMTTLEATVSPQPQRLEGQTLLPFAAKPTPESQVFEILRRARERFGRDLRPFYAEIRSSLPRSPANEFADLAAVAMHRRESS